MSSFKAKQRKWLREASMRRLSQIVKDKTELIDSAQKLRMNVATIEGLEESGLSKQSIQHLENWVEGVESGRECMFALLDTLHNSKDIAPSTKTGQFKPLDVVQALLNLPEEFLCDHGYLFEKVFSRPPATVVKEAVQIIVKKAEEQNSSSLGLQQINLALKQLRLDAICSANPIVEPVAVAAATSDDAPTGEVDETKDHEAAADTIDDHVRQQIVLRVKIITELLRIHIKTMAKRKTAAALHLAGKKPSTTTAAAHRFNAFHNNDPDRLDDDDEDDATADAAAFDLRKLREFVSTPVQEVHAQAMQSPAESLEQTNTVLKPYLRRLSSLKMLLTTQLNELRDSKAFLSLGLSPDASDEDIKRAYRVLAVRLHPDKPGGDTAKFQQLQAMYQEVLKRRKTKRDEDDAVQQMKAKRQEAQQAQAQYRRQRDSGRAPSATATKEEDEEDGDEDTAGANDATAAADEDEDRELDELLRKIDRDLQRDAEDLAGFSTQKAQLKRRGGLATDDESEEEKPRRRANDSDDGNDSDGDGDGDKENLHEGSENDASSTGDSPRRTSDTKPSTTRRTAAASQPSSSSSSPDEPDAEAEALPGDGGEPLVEDVDDDEDDDADVLGGGRFGSSGSRRAPSSSSSSSSSSAHNGSRLAAALLKLALPDRPTGPFPTDEAHAAALVQYTATLLPLLHQAASKATQATQRLIKWQKQWDKLFKDAALTSTQRLDRLLHVAVQALGGHVAFIDHISAPSTSLSTSASSVSTFHEAQRQRLLASPIRAVAPALEVVCDISQRIAATGMSLASDCGTDYMAAISLETTFLREIEGTMNDSLGCLRAVVPLSTSLDQLMSCVQRAYDTQRLTLSSSSLASSSTLVDLLADMMRTAMKNAVGSHCGAVDGLMAAATTATALSERLRDLQSKVQRQVLLDAKRHADYERMRHEEEEEYSAEDREAMRRARSMQQQPPSPRSKDGADGDEDNDEDGDEAAAAQQRKNGAAADDDDGVDPLTGEALRGMDLLKHKIRKLQVQLYLQQVAALQTMNAETVTLQDHILRELQSMTFLAAPKATATTTSAAAAATTTATATAAVAVQGVSSEVVESVVSLVAEMLDASLAQFRLQYQQHRPSLSSLSSRPTDTFVTQLIHTYTTSDERAASARRLRHGVDRDWVAEALTKHLVWCVDVVLSDHSHVALPTLLTQAEFTVPDADTDADAGAGAGADGDANAETTEPTVASTPPPPPPPAPKMMPKVALWPDYRAKTLYLASVLDLPAVRHLLFAELPQKLQEIFAEDD